MSTTIRSLTMAAALSLAASAASAVTVTPFDTPLSAGDDTFGNAIAIAFESFGMTQLSFTAADPLNAMVSVTVNPFKQDLQGNPTNSISVSYAINGGVATALPIIANPPTGSASMSQALSAGDVFTFFVSGTAGQSGNQVTFAVETVEAVPLPAGAALLGLALGGIAVVGRRKPA